MVESIRRSALYTAVRTIPGQRASPECQELQLRYLRYVLMDMEVSLSSPTRGGAGNIWTRSRQGWADEDMPGWESFEMQFCVRVH